jgi:hypothetical protein
MPDDSSHHRKIVFDDDWKERVQAEKAAAARQSAAASASTGSAQQEAAHEPLPPPSLSVLISTLATQAVAALQPADSSPGQTAQDRLALAKYHIDLLGILADKTKGNLTSEEAKLLETILHELRMLYVTGKR